jgi:hypothetical protein
MLTHADAYLHADEVVATGLRTDARNKHGVSRCQKPRVGFPDSVYAGSLYELQEYNMPSSQPAPPPRNLISPPRNHLSALR